MEVLPPLEVPSQPQSVYYRGLPTPTSSSSLLSLDSLTRTSSHDDRMTIGPGPFRSISSYQVPSKPSLPSLRDILKEPLASPPATPVTSRLPQHISPVDYESNDYKRVCTNLSWGGRQPAHSSPAHPATSEMHSRRDSATTNDFRQPKERHRLGNSFLPELRTTGLDSRTGSPEQTGSAASRKRSYDRAMNSDSLDGPSSWGATPARTPLTTRNDASYTLLSSRSNEMFTDYQSQPRSQLPPPPNFARSNGPSYVLPPAYELPLAKARKRSNLPKESTDVMKKWFDEHMDNPYPSEEEKKMFAAKAGISLTQVSNWFINHRRRCPDLREARDRRQPMNVRRPSDEMSPPGYPSI